MRDTVPSPLFATQAAPAPTATPDGRCPTRTVSRTAPVSGSIRTTVPSSASVTHTDPGPTATPAGPLPTGIASAAPLSASIRLTVLPSASATQIAPAPAATALGARPPGSIPGRATSPVRASTSVRRPSSGATSRCRPARVTSAVPSLAAAMFTEPASASKPGSILLSVTNGFARFAVATQTAPSAVASPPGVAPTPIVRPTCSGRVSIRVTERSSTLATHSELDFGSKVSGPGRAPTEATFVTSFVAGSIATTA